MPTGWMAGWYEPPNPQWNPNRSKGDKNARRKANKAARVARKKQRR